MTKYKQGYFLPQHPEKYVGDITKIRFMSSWELEFFKFADNNPNVLKWSSEEIPIKYIKPTDGRVHKYYPDIFISYKDKHGNIKWELIEIKPLTQTKRPRTKNGQPPLYETIQWVVNQAKWEAAHRWCETMTHQLGAPVTFRILTERQIFK